MTGSEAIEQLEEAIADLGALHSMILSLLTSTALDTEAAAAVECIGKLVLAGISKADGTTVTLRRAIGGAA